MKRVVAIFAIIVVVVVCVGILIGGFTHNLKKVMPKYDTVIYSESNFLSYDKNLLEYAKVELDYKYNKIKNKNYKDGDYYKRGLREILRINKTNLDRYLEKYSEEKAVKYKKLPITEYKEIIDNYGYNAVDKKTKLDLYLNFNDCKEEELYYEIEGFWYLPSENRELVNVVATKSNIERGNQKFKILKDAEICIAQGSNFLFAANIAYIDRTNGTSFEKRIKIKDFFNGTKNLENINFVDNNEGLNNESEILKNQDMNEEELRQLTKKEIEELIFMLTTMHMNYVTYDEKGYICDMYYFEKSS